MNTLGVLFLSFFVLAVTLLFVLLCFPPFSCNLSCLLFSFCHNNNSFVSPIFISCILFFSCFITIMLCFLSCFLSTNDCLLLALLFCPYCLTLLSPEPPSVAVARTTRGGWGRGGYTSRESRRIETLRSPLWMMKQSGPA